MRGNNKQKPYIKPLPEDKIVLLNQLNDYAANQIKNVFQTIKTSDKKQKYDDNDLTVLSKIIQKKPSKMSFVYSLANKPQMNGKVLIKISTQNYPTIKLVDEFASIMTKKGEPRYSASNLQTFSMIPSAKLKNILPLASDEKISNDSIANISKFGCDVRLEKIINNINELKKTFGPDLKKIEFSPNKFEDNKYNIVAEYKDGSLNKKKTLQLDRKINVYAVQNETIVDKLFSSSVEVHSRDLRTQAVSEQKWLNGKLISENIHDVNKNLSISTMATDEKGFYSHKFTTPQGKNIALSDVTVHENGTKFIRHDNVSVDGISSKFKHVVSKNGDKLTSVEIKKPDGEVLFKETRDLRVLPNNYVRTTIGNNDYLTSVKGDIISVKIKTGRVYKIDTKKLIENHDDNKSATMLSKYRQKEKLKNLLRTTYGDELIKFSQCVGAVAINENIDSANSKKNRSIGGIKKENRHDSNAMDSLDFSNKKSITIPSDCDYVFLHELGHAKSKKYNTDNLEYDEQFREIFANEKKLFNEIFPDAQREHLEYFTANPHGKEEFIAEVNAMLKTYSNKDKLSVREQYLRQYFPNSIAYVANKL